MPGLYANDDRRYIEVPSLEHGHWYTDDDGALFIMPDPQYGLCDSVGPDDVNAETLTHLYSKTAFDKLDPNEVSRNHGLTAIPNVLKRFDPQIGYFTA